MNTLGLSMLVKLGCPCTKESLYINGQKYYIVETIGEGGFSTVSLIEQANSKKKYALKKITCHGREDQKNALQEVEYHRQFQHSNILSCIDHEIVTSSENILNQSSKVYIVLPFLKRGTLANELELRSIARQHMQPLEIIKMFIQICEGVKVLHDAQPEPLAHRDLKTANILLNDDNTPVIMDLGSMGPATIEVTNSNEAQKLQDMASERCSMAYRAPELFNVESSCLIDQRTDIWSLGCVLYAMCYFKSPFDIVHERGDSVALAAISGSINFPEPQIYPQEMHELILFMLRVNPMERPYVYSVIEKATDLLENFMNNPRIVDVNTYSDSVIT